MPITKDLNDQYRFVRSLYYLNDLFFDKNWSTVALRNSPTVPSDKLFFRPLEWPARKPIVEILAYTLMPNHLHFLLKEIRENGIALFMKKLGQSMTNHFNEKYKSKGSIFQGGYKGKTITEDDYLRYLAVYIMVKNPFELYPNGGLEGAIKNFDDAWQWAIDYPFSSLGDYAGKRKNSPILKKGLLGEIFSKPCDFKNFAKDCILGRKSEVISFE